MGERPTPQSPFQVAWFHLAERSHLIIPCWLKLLRWGGGKYSGLLKKKLQILLPAYLGVGKNQSRPLAGSLSKPVPSPSR